MRSLLSQRFVWVLAMLFFAVSCCLSVHATETKKVTFSKKTKQMISRADIFIGDVPKHTIAQWIRIDAITFSNPDFGSGEEWVYGHSDHIAGSGIHKGYSVYNLKNGDKIYVKWEGTHKTTIKEGAWELKHEGTMQFISATGKFKNIKGEGVYKGMMSAKDSATSGNFEATY